MQTQRINIKTKKLYDVDTNLYSQFMEPLGTTDGSVEAAWDFDKAQWRKDVIEVTKKLAPPMMRWGGLFSAYYHWKEAVGEPKKRIPMYNIEWGGFESNQVGTHEFLSFCKIVGAEPLINVNFEGDGITHLIASPFAEDRRGGAEEAAQWVDYCNNPDNRERIANGQKEPYNVRYWQIGNETSYFKDSTFTADVAAKKTLEFARAMRWADHSIKIIGWGDGRNDSNWTKTMVDTAGEYLEYLDFHHLFGNADMDESPLIDNRYLEDADATWEYLMGCHKLVETKLDEIRTQISPFPNIKAALCECHFSIRAKNRGDVLTTWAAGVSNARILNSQFRNGDILKIGNLSDFCGTRWQVNTVMIPTPIRTHYHAYLLPVGLVTMLYRNHIGNEAVEVNCTSSSIDITASRTNNTYYLHLINTDNKKSETVNFNIEGKTICKIRVFELAADPMFEVNENTAEELQIKEYTVGDDFTYSIPAASVSAVEISVKALKPQQCLCD